MSESAAAALPLAGCRVGISVSESTDLAVLGFLQPEKSGDLPADLQRVLCEVIVALVAAGVTIVYGGDMRPDGFTLPLMREAADAYRAAELESADLVFVNVLAGAVWRKASSEELFAQSKSFGELGQIDLMLPDGQRIELRARFETLRQNLSPKCIVELSCNSLGLSEAVETAGALERLLAPIKASPEPDFVESLTAMRRSMANDEAARLVIGGRVNGYGGGRADAKPGIPEEALASLQAGKLLLPVASFGGAAHDVAQALGLLTDGPLVTHTNVGPNYQETITQIADRAESFHDVVATHGVALDDVVELTRSDVPTRIAMLTLRAFGRWHAIGGAGAMGTSPPA